MTDHIESDRLFERLAAGDPSARDALVVHHRGLARYLARRFSGKGEALEDLEQVAAIGLIKAVDGFDIERGVRFSTYATATITGELKRHLRDKGWAMRVPRGLKRDSLLLGRIEQELSQRIGRSPTVAELAAEADLSPEEVVEALEAGRAYSISSLDSPLGDADDDSMTLGDTVQAPEDLIALADRLAVAAGAIEQLPDRERRILYLRFYEDMTQTEIGEAMGMSQMHVSRLLSRSLDSIRDFLRQTD